MNYTIRLLLLLFVINSCQESKKVEVVAEENEFTGKNSPRPTSYIIKTDTLENQSSITKSDSILPTPDSEFFVDLDSSDVNGILIKYLNTNKIKSVYKDNYDGSYVIELEHYSLKEVKRILRILLPKMNEDNSDLDGWHEGIYYYEGMCNLEIRKEENVIIVDYGCSC